MVFNFVLVSSKILNVPMGESRSRPAQGRAGEILVRASGFDSTAASLQNHFEYPEGYACLMN